MGLKSEYVKMQIGNRNKKYYAQLGYKIPEYKGQNSGIKIDVKFTDVPKGSVIKIDCECDNCGKDLNWSVQDYYRSNRDGKTYCNKCVHALFNSGKNNNKWNPNLTDEERKQRRLDPEYVIFTRKVLARDNYKCQCCGHVGSHLEVHHLNGFDNFIDERLDENNAVVLCEKCHNNFHDHYGRGNNTKEQYEEWIGYVIDYLGKFNGKLPLPRRIICLEDNIIYNSAKDASEKTGINKSVIQKCCLMYDTFKYGTTTKSVKGKHYLYYDVYSKMTEEELKEYLEWTKIKSFHSKDGRHTSCKSIICINNKIIYRAIADAAKKLSLSSGGLTDCCKGKYKSCGVSENNEPLHWMYLEDYIQKYGDIGLIYD